MSQNLIELEEEFLNKHPHLPKRSRRYTRTSNLGGLTIIASIMIHMANFSFIESFELFLFMIIIPLIILIVLHVTAGKDYIEEFDLAMHDYIPKLLNSIEGSSLEYQGYKVEMKNTEIKKLGFLHENIHPSFKPIRKHYIKGVYKNIEVEICELDYRHIKSKSRGLNLGWKPSTLISFDYPSQFNGMLNIYMKDSANYPSDDIDSFPSIHSLYKMIKLNGKKSKTNIKHFDYKYYTFTSNEQATNDLFTSDFLDKILCFHKLNYRIKGDKIYDAKFFTLNNNKISILIFNRKLLYPRINNIFEAYTRELKSILQFVDIFSTAELLDKTDGNM